MLASPWQIWTWASSRLAAIHHRVAPMAKGVLALVSPDPMIVPARRRFPVNESCASLWVVLQELWLRVGMEDDCRERAIRLWSRARSIPAAGFDVSVRTQTASEVGPMALAANCARPIG